MMEASKNGNNKTANQTWRKKPRKWAPKSRLGCRTCKIRRVKCDLSQPACSKCQSTGRTCDGYTEMPPTSKTWVEPSHDYNDKASKSESGDTDQPCTTTSAYQLGHPHADYDGLILQNPRPLMILPMTRAVQTEAMCFFEYISIKHLDEYNPCQSWRDSLMFFSQTVPPVRYAAVALALMHRNYLDRDSNGGVHQEQASKSWLSDKAALLYYNRAIQLLLNQDIGDSTETTAITLLVCYLFICFDHLAGNYVQAMKHLRGGVDLSRNIDKAILDDSHTYGGANASGAHMLICQVTRQIRRLDLQPVMFLVDWTPINVQETISSQFPLSGGAFSSLDHAADHLQILIARVMRLRNTEQQLSPSGKMPPLPSSLKGIVLGQLEAWSSLFEDMLQQGSAHATDPENDRRISLLRLQYTTAWTFLSSYGPGGEADYDKFLPQFQQCVALAGELATAHERYSGSLKPTFTPEIGIIPVLYIIGVKCRHPVVRRQALSILRRQPIREAVWDSICAARVVERVIEIEESGSEEWEVVQSMEKLPVWQRIEGLSWVQVVNGQSGGRVDIRYTYCAREGTHTESLTI